MLIHICIGGEYKRLQEQVRALESTVEELQAEIKDLQEEMDGHEHAEEFPAFDDLDSRLKNLDYWKADRHHTHKEADDAAAT